MLGTGTEIHWIAKLRAQILRFAPWQTALKWTADCQAPRSGCKEYVRSGQACGNPLSNGYFRLWQSAVWLFYSWQTAVFRPRIATIRGKHLSLELSKRLNASSRTFASRVPLFVDASELFDARLFRGKLIRSGLFRPKLITNCFSWQTISWHYTFKSQ
jgi:hypothetical protein